MLHRAILGSFERFIGILIEEHAGALPTWLAPGAGGGAEYHRSAGRFRREVEKTLRIRVFGSADLRNEKIGFKIREHTFRRFPTCWWSGTESWNLVPSLCVPGRGRTLGHARFRAFVEKLWPGDVAQLGRQFGGLNIALKSRKKFTAAPGDEKHINEQIVTKEVRLIGQEGEQLGIMPLQEALESCRGGRTRSGGDGHRIRKWPVCRIMDYGKFKFEQSKKQQAAKKKQKQVQVKEIKFRPAPMTATIKVKVRNLRAFPRGW
jgi:hypothetical protein